MPGGHEFLIYIANLAARNNLVNSLSPWIDDALKKALWHEQVGHEINLPATLVKPRWVNHRSIVESQTVLPQDFGPLLGKPGI